MKKVSPIMIISWLIIVIGGIYLLVLLSRDKTVYENNQINESQENSAIENMNEINEAEESVIGDAEVSTLPLSDFTPELMTKEEKMGLGLSEDLNVMVLGKSQDGTITSYEIVVDEISTPPLTAEEVEALEEIIVE